MPDNVLTGKVVITAPGVEQTFGKVAAAVTKTEAGLKQVSRTSSSATQSLINLGRVVQDAPYGFIGIANNINPLLESFQRLKAESGSTSVAIKAFAGSLIGAGGLGLAVSVVTSLLTVFSLSSRGAKKETEALNTETDAAAEKQKEFQSAVDSAAKSLIQQAKNLDDVRAILVSTTATTEQLTAATIRQGVARLIFDQKNSELQKILSAEIERQFLLRKRIAGINGAAEFVSDAELDKLKQYQTSLQGLGKGDIGLVKTIKRIEELNEVIGSSKGSLNLLNSISGDLQKFFKGFVGEPDSLKLNPKKVEIEKDFNLDPIDVPTYFDRLNEDKRSRFQKQLDEFSAKVQLKIPITFDLSKPQQGFQNLLAKNAADLSAIRKPAEDLGKAFTSALSGAITGGLESIGEGIGNVLSGKGFGSAIVGVIGDLLTQLGKALIAYGAVKSGLDKILGPGGLLIPGGVAIGLGVAAIAFGSIFKNFKGARELGGPVSASGTYLVGEKGPELFTPNTGGSITPNNKLGGVGVSGGGVSVQVSGAFRLSGKDLIAAIVLSQQSNARLV